MPHVVIVGAGFGGLEAAKRLRHAPVKVTVIDRTNHHLFQPMLEQVATARLSMEDISAPIRSILKRQQNTSVILAEVIGVDVQGQRVLTPDQAIPYDYLIVATGTSSNYFGHDAWKLFAPGLKSLQEAMALRRDILCAFEVAENEPDPQKRQALLTFVLVGLQLLGLSLQARSDPHDLPPLLSGTHRYIMDYLTEEVLRQQPAAVQRFLLRTSILNRLSASLCGVVAEQTDSQQMLDYLERANVFVIPLDEQCRWYRYHALFAEALRARLEWEEEEAIPALHLRASQWYEQQGHISEAVQHALQAQAWQRVADLIEPFTEAHLWRQYEQPWRHHEEVPLMLCWLRQIPAEVMQTRPRLAMYYARMLFITGSLRETEPWVRAAEAGLAASEPPRSQQGDRPLEDASSTSEVLPRDHERERLLGEVAARRAVVAAYYGERQRALEQCQQARSHLSEQDLFQHSLVAVAQGLSAFSAGQAIPATQHLLEAGALTQSTGIPGAAINYLSTAASFLHLQGRLHEARQVFQQAIELGTPSAGHPFATVGVAYTYLADVLREWNQLDEALDLARQGIRFVEETKYTLYADQAYMALVRIYLSRGEVEAASTTLQQALQLPTLVDNPYRRSWLTTVEQVRLWIALGELDQALHWARELERNQPEILFAREREEIALVRLLLAKREPEKALERLKPLVMGATSTERWDCVLEMRLLQAIAAQMGGREHEALTALAQAVRLGEAEGYIRRFVDEGPPMAALLARLRDQQRRQGPTPYLDTVLAAFPQEGAGAKPLPQQGLLDPLSERELEVLHLVAQGASNQEIADTLVLSVQTVKRHVYNILGKLQASNRTQVVTRAQVLGLLSDEQRRATTNPTKQKEWEFLFSPHKEVVSRVGIKLTS